MQVVASGPDVAGDPLYESLLALIFSADKRIWIVTPYFVPDEMLARAINLAARRGVNVRLMVQPHRNHLVADLARAGYLRDLHNAGGRVLLHAPVMLHAKVVIFDDDLAIIGSANMDMRSLFLNYELALFLRSPAPRSRRSRPGPVASWWTRTGNSPPPTGRASSRKMSYGSYPPCYNDRDRGHMRCREPKASGTRTRSSMRSMSVDSTTPTETGMAT